jgi:hypothetical protein
MKNRRVFLKEVSIGTASLIVFKIPFQSKNILYKNLYVKETNFTLKTNFPTVIGFLYSDFPGKVEHDINQLRIKNHYRCKLSYGSDDKFKLNFTKDVIDYFFQEPSLYFYARLINGRLDTEKNNLNLVHDIVYRVNYKKAINDLKTITKVSDFYLDCKSKKRVIPDSSIPPESYQYENFHTDKMDLVNYLNRSIPNVNIKLKDYQKNNLSQLSDFLTGSIYGDIVGTQSATKRNLLIYLKNKLHIKKSSEIYNAKGHKKFFISGSYK